MAAVKPSFDLEAAHEITRKEEEATQERVADALTKRFNKDAEAMPALKVYELAPYGSVMSQVMRHFLQSSYRSYVNQADLDLKAHSLFESYRSCTEQEEEQLEEFWTQVKKQADEKLETIQTKKKKKEEEVQEAAKQAAAAAPEATASS